MDSERKKILLYDSNRFLYRYFTSSFLNKYDIVFFADVEVEEVNLNQYNVIIFIVEKPIEFIELFKIYNKGVPIIFGCFENKFYLRREEVEEKCDVNIIDMTGTKMEVKDQIKMHLQTVFAN